MRQLRILVVDDSVVVRRVVTEALQHEADIEVAAAPNGRIALGKLEQLAPDAVILDVDMPELDGLETLKALRRTHPSLPVIMFSSLTKRGAVATLDALALGATDYVTKPVGTDLKASVQMVRQELVPRLRTFCRPGGGSESSPASPRLTREPVATRRADQDAEEQRVEAVVIAVSTGGPKALAELLPSLAPEFPVPVFIVQHMPPLFTKYLAERLATKSRIPVRESGHGMTVRPATVWIAPGGVHTELRRTATTVQLVLTEGPPENSCRPSADVLLRSAADVYGGGTLAVVLTGMGQDGLRGCRRVREVGGRVLVQDEATSVVWGMPGAIARAGLADRLLPLEEIGAEIFNRVAACRAPTIPVPR